MIDQGTFLVSFFLETMALVEVCGRRHARRATKWHQMAHDAVGASAAAGVKIALGTDAGLGPSPRHESAGTRPAGQVRRAHAHGGHRRGHAGPRPNCAASTANSARSRRASSPTWSWCGVIHSPTSRAVGRPENILLRAQGRCRGERSRRVPRPGLAFCLEVLGAPDEHRRELPCAASAVRSAHHGRVAPRRRLTSPASQALAPGGGQLERPGPAPAALTGRRPPGPRTAVPPADPGGTAA